MYMSSLWLSLWLCVLAFCADQARGIHCYSCESVYESGCGEDFDAEPYFKLDCSRMDPPRYLEMDLMENRNASACMKTEYLELGVKRIVRSCFFGDVNDTETGCRLDPSLADVQDERCFVCDDESYCNRSARPSLAFVGVTLLLGFVSLAQMIDGR